MASLKDFRTAALGAVMAVASLGAAFTPAAHADPAANTNAPQAQEVSLDASYGRQIIEATNVASEYSKTNRAVGIVLVYTGGPGLPGANVIGDGLVAQFKAKGVDSAYFVVPSPKPGAAAAYVIEDVTIGPFGDKATAAANIDKAVSMRRGANNVLAMNSP